MSAAFELTGGGIGVMPDPADNPSGHVVPHSDAGLEVTNEVVNVGDEAGTARVGVEVDDVFQLEWQSQQVEPGSSEEVRVQLGRFGPGEHTVLMYVNPGSGQNDHETSTVDLE